MRKFYSIVLMAAALLVGTNVKAAVMNWEELSAAIAAAGADETTIVLGADISTSSPIDARGKNLVLDLAGYDITSTAGYIIQIKDGATNDDAQRIGGKLSIINSAKATKQSTISGTGWAAYVQGAANDVADFAVLKIGEGVRLTTTNDYGLVLYNAQGLNSKNKATTIKAGYGIVVEVNGYVQAAAHGMWVMGNIQAQSGNIPQVTVGATGSLIGGNGGVEGTEDMAGLAGMGYANYVIKGTVSGAVGIYAKAGKYTITDNAQVTATTTSHTEIDPNSNGFTGGVGSAIVSDTKAGYAGGMNISISGNATITTNAPSGYAIEEKVSDGDQYPSATEKLVIESGTINGDLQTTAELKENIRLNGTITGGTYSGDISSYLNGAEAVAQTDPQTGKTTYVVSVAVQVNVNAASFSTFSAKKAVVLPAGLTAYQATSRNGDELVLTAVAVSGETLAANCGVILHGESGKLVEGDDAGAKTVSADNFLRPATAWDANYAGVAYILHGSELWIYDGEEFPANKAFFLLQDPNGAPERIRLVFAAEDEATAIDNVETTVESVKFVENGQLFIRRGENIYNVQGQIVK